MAPRKKRATRPKNQKPTRTQPSRKRRRSEESDLAEEPTTNKRARSGASPTAQDDTAPSGDRQAIVRRPTARVAPTDRSEVDDQYGNLGDGLTIAPTITRAEFEALQIAYMRRRDLAQLSAAPENARVRHQVNGRIHWFELRTPPSIHLQMINGVPRRVARHDYVPDQEEEDEYLTYLLDNHLPTWFLSAEHLEMLTGDRDRTEREQLDIDLHSRVRFAADNFAGPIDNGDGALYNELDDIEAVRDQIRELDGFLNMPYIPSVPGQWTWGSHEDRQAAFALGAGLYTPLDVALARANPTVFGIRPRELPNVIWFPDYRYFNPLEAPTEQGHWEFHTPDDAEVAALNYGGRLNNFDLPDHPSAADIFHIRFNLFRFRIDFANDINIVWIPEQPGNAVEPQEDPEPAEHTRQQPPPQSPQPRSSPDESSEDSGDEVAAPVQGAIDATNGEAGGDYDQTSQRPADAQYARIDVRKYGKLSLVVVVDRSAAQLRRPEPHKLHVFNKKAWRTYPQATGFDWDDPDSIFKLNKWRDALNFPRQGNNAQRGLLKPIYTDAERQWMHEQVQSHRYGPPGGFTQFSERWHERFGDDVRRSESALYRFWHRVKSEGRPMGPEQRRQRLLQLAQERRPTGDNSATSATRPAPGARHSAPPDIPSPSSSSSSGGLFVSPWPSPRRDGEGNSSDGDARTALQRLRPRSGRGGSDRR